MGKKVFSILRYATVSKRMPYLLNQPKMEMQLVTDTVPC